MCIMVYTYNTHAIHKYMCTCMHTMCVCVCVCVCVYCMHVFLSRVYIYTHTCIACIYLSKVAAAGNSWAHNHHTQPTWKPLSTAIQMRVGVSVSVFLCVSVRAFAEGVVSIRCECMAL